MEPAATGPVCLRDPGGGIACCLNKRYGFEGAATRAPVF